MGLEAVDETEVLKFLRLFRESGLVQEFEVVALRVATDCPRDRSRSGSAGRDHRADGPCWDQWQVRNRMPDRAHGGVPMPRRPEGEKVRAPRLVALRWRPEREQAQPGAEVLPGEEAAMVEKVAGPGAPGQEAGSLE